MTAELNVRGAGDAGAISTLDAAIIATPTVAHAAIASALIARGVHVLIEKPVVRNANEGRAIEQLAAENPGVVVQVGHIERFNPAVAALGPLADPPWYIVGERLGPFKERSIDVDVIDDLMIHDLDLALRWLGGPVREVRAVGVSIFTDHVDMANARLEFASGAIANLTASRSSLESSRKLRLFTAERYLSLDLEKKQVKSVRRLPPPPGEKWPEISAEALPVGADDALLAEDRAFVAACLGRAPTPVTLADGLAAVELAAHIKRELRTPGKLEL
jgi:predicted dehydrogenase